jgi:ribokinase
VEDRASPQIVVIGSANIDFIMKMDRLPRVGESVTNATFSQALGGKGANQAVAAARSSRGARVGVPAAGRVALVASVGSDQYGTDMLESWKESGLLTNHVTRAEGHTGSALIMIGEGGHNFIAAAPAANDQLRPEHIDSLLPVLSAAVVILIQFEVPEDTTERILQVASGVDASLVWNVAPMRALRPDLVGMTDIVVVNETEAELITGIPVTDAATAQKAAGAIRDLGATTAIVTLGEAGSLLVSEDGASLVPAFPVEAVDSTAAGDTYCGCLVTALSEGMKIPQAVRFASAGAALSVGRLGAQPSVPWRSEIDEFISRSSDTA